MEQDNKTLNYNTNETDEKLTSKKDGNKNTDGKKMNSKKTTNKKMSDKNDSKKINWFGKKCTIIMLVVAILSMGCTIALTAAMIMMGNYGILGGQGEAAVTDSQMELMQDRYSIYAITGSEGNYHMDSLKNTNLHYGVYKSSEPEVSEEILSNPDNYLIHNFDDKFSYGDAHIFNTYLDSNTSVRYNISSIWGYAGISHARNGYSSETAELYIKGFYYDWMTDKLYALTDDAILYQIESAFYVSKGQKSEKVENLKNYVAAEGETEWILADSLVEIEQFGYRLPFNQIELVSDFDISRLGDLNTDGRITKMDVGRLWVSYDLTEPKEYYTVVSYVNNPLDPTLCGTKAVPDLFLETQKFYSTIYDLKYVIVTLYILSVLTITFCGLYWFIRICRLLYRSFGKVRIMWKLSIVMFLGFCFLCIFSESVFVIFVYVVIISPIVFYFGWQYRKQVIACEKLAKGNLDSKVDTKLMLWDLKKQGDNINAIGESINTAVEERMKSERMKAELITNVSHDIKTPLTSIINYVDLLSREDIDNENAKEYIEVLMRQSEKLKKLIVDLIEASKASTGNLEINAEPCDIKMALMQVVGEYEDRLSEKNISLVVNATEEAMIMADGRYLFRIFDNLLINIQKYSMENTRAYIDMVATEKEVKISFKNISKDVLHGSGEEFMERFMQGDTSRNSDGNGLGLAIAKSLTELMEGTIAVTVDGDLFKVDLTWPRIEVKNS